MGIRHVILAVLLCQVVQSAPASFYRDPHQKSAIAKAGTSTSTDLPFICSPCLPGTGVAKPCSQSEDTVCAHCPIRFHSDTTSTHAQCRPCSRCGSGLFELHACNLTNDVFCERCEHHNAWGNEDFVRKCLHASIVAKKGMGGAFDDGNDNGFRPMKDNTLAKENAVDVNAVKTDNNHNNKEVQVGDILKAGSKTDLRKNSFGIYEKVEVLLQRDQPTDLLQNNDDDTSSENAETTQTGTNKNKSVPEELDLSTPVENDHVKSTVIETYGNGATLDPIAAADSSGEVDPINQEKISGSRSGSSSGSGSGSGSPGDLGNEESGDEDVGIYQPMEFTIRLDVTEKPKTTVFTTKPTVKPTTQYDESRNDDHKFPLVGGVPVSNSDLDIDKYDQSAPKGDKEPNEVYPVKMVKPQKPSDKPVGAFAGEQASVGEQKDPKAKAETRINTFAIIIAIVTAGIIFFALGFFLHRYKCGGAETKAVSATNQAMRLKPIYRPTATEPPMDEVKFKPEVAVTTQAYQMAAPPPRTPEIIYTNHDEPDVGRQSPDVVLPPPPSAGTKRPDLRKAMPPIGKYQSPIDIDPDEAELSDELQQSKMLAKYVPENTKSLTNLGNTVKVMVDCRGSDLHGGPLGNNRYCLDHFRFRWGAEDSRGSEHSVAGKRYAGEIQLVHWNKEDFRTYAEASRYETGLCIVSIFMQVSENPHGDLQTLLDVFKSIKHKGDSVEVPHHYFDPASLLPGNTLDYWTYPGSLTESPHNETVTWVILKEPINVSSAQMSTFRSLLRTEKDETHGAPGEPLVDNFREQAALGDRSLRASFR